MALTRYGRRHFNSRLRTGGDGQPARVLCAGIISTHASAREATRVDVRTYQGLFISTHASAREATKFLLGGCQYRVISTHASAREATTPGLLAVRINTISTHASAREATCKQAQGNLGADLISTHASAREATEIVDSVSGRSGFQLTPPHGRRRGQAIAWEEAFSISTHASAREATVLGFAEVKHHLNFNSRLRTGGDHLSAHQLRGSCHFNSRLRTGGDSRQQLRRS